MMSTPNARRDLFETMKQVAETGRGPQGQIASMAVRSSGSTEDAWATLLGRGPKEAVEVIHQRTGTLLLGEKS
jgi:hypothetical protein